MVNDPLSKVEAFVAAGADVITFHLEGAHQPHRVLQALRNARNVNEPSRGIIRGVALNPSTPVTYIEPLLDEADYILVLGINPGWSGQAILATTERRVQQVREILTASGRPILLGIDGGVNKQNIDHVLAMGADIVVTGSAIFDGKTPAANARFMLERARAAHSAHS